MSILVGKKGLIIGIANQDSIAYGCAREMHAAGASLAITYLNNKSKNYVAPIAEELQAGICMPLDVTNDEQHKHLFSAIENKWGKLDFLLHSIAFAPKQDLQKPLIDSTRDGFLTAIDISCHSLVRLAQAAKPLMIDGGSIITMSYYGAWRVVNNYNLMGPVKAALEASVKYLSVDLGQQNIRINTLSPGPVKTRAASGLTDFDTLMHIAAERAPLHQLVTLQQIGHAATFLASDNAQQITGQTLFVDAGYNTVG